MSSVQESPKKMIRLRSLDGELFEMEEKAAMLSVTIKNRIEEGCTDDVIPILMVNGKNLAVVIDYCKLHVEGEPEEMAKTFDAELANKPYPVMFELINAANYMDIKGLIDLLCQAVADRIEGESVENIRLIFGIENDFTPEEELAVRNENAWAFEEFSNCLLDFGPFFMLLSFIFMFAFCC